MSVVFDEAYLAGGLYKDDLVDLEKRFSFRAKTIEDIIAHEPDISWLADLKTKIRRIASLDKEYFPTGFFHLQDAIDTVDTLLAGYFDSQMQSLSSTADCTEDRSCLAQVSAQARTLHEIADQHGYASDDFLTTEISMAEKYHDMSVNPHDYGLHKKIRVCKKTIFSACHATARYLKATGQRYAEKHLQEKIVPVSSISRSFKHHAYLGLILGGVLCAGLPRSDYVSKELSDNKRGIDEYSSVSLLDETVDENMTDTATYFTIDIFSKAYSSNAFEELSFSPTTEHSQSQTETLTRASISSSEKLSSPVIDGSLDEKIAPLHHFAVESAVNESSVDLDLFNDADALEKYK